MPPFAGFWSKDEILLYAFAKSPVLYVFGLVTALLTAYYMTRQVIMVFFGEARWTRRTPTSTARTATSSRTRARGSMLPPAGRARRSVASSVARCSCRSPRDLHFLEKWLEPVIEFGEADIHGTWAYDNKYLLARRRRR